MLGSVCLGLHIGHPLRGFVTVLSSGVWTSPLCLCIPSTQRGAWHIVDTLEIFVE